MMVSGRGEPVKTEGDLFLFQKAHSPPNHTPKGNLAEARCRLLLLFLLMTSDGPSDKADCTNLVPLFTPFTSMQPSTRHTAATHQTPAQLRINTWNGQHTSLGVEKPPACLLLGVGASTSVKIQATVQIDGITS
ncbi:hypothetical protein DBR06_SOUSAS23610035 [Sousa chinensis]|uniref:Uncharacterized protein n=1 Tax=Sousa chinensis TaxID=103600 RepID=A0A484GXW0_SOUCH|nr:hypothetical protein DBR06_SOUSAS23610035 [Sousa chinensis]